MSAPVKFSRSLAVWRFVRDRYFVLDVRVLGVFRIGFGLVLLVDVLGRLAHSTFFYSNDGCLSNHFSLFDPIAHPYLSVFVLFSTPGEVRVALLGTALVFAAYLVGYRTRAAQVLTFILYTSLNARNLFLENGGTVVVGILAAWTIFLPLGDRFSVDAFLARVNSARSPNETPIVRPRSSAYVSLAALAIALQLAIIYTFNAIHKTGPTWTSGQVIHLILWQNRVATPIAAWLRLHEPSWLSPLLTRSALVTEGLAPLLILMPIAQRYTRTASLFITTALHAGIALLISLGPFSYAMIAMNLLLLPREAADWVARRFEGGRLEGASADAAGWVAERWKRFGGGLPEEPEASGQGAARIGIFLREACIFVLLVAVGIEVTNDNEAVPPDLRLHQPEVLGALISYPRLLQGWSMFAPDAPQTDGTIVVDGVTVDHRHIDPFTGNPPDLNVSLHGPWYLGSLFCDYFGRISDAPDYQDELKKYLMNWQEIEGRPDRDRLISVTAYWVSSEAPVPGRTRPRNIGRTVMFKEPEEEPAP